MRHNYKIRIDEPEPDEKKIVRHKNFSSVLSDYNSLTQPLNRRPLYKNPKAFLGLLLILTMGFLVFKAVEEEEDLEKNMSQNEVVNDLPTALKEAEQNAFYQPFLSELGTPVTEFSISPDEKQQLKLPSGTEISIPKGAFSVNPAPSDSVAMVTVRIREFRDPVSIAANGIPMYGWEDGKRSGETESMGMIEITAVQGDQALVLNEGVKIEISTPVMHAAPLKELAVFSLEHKVRSWRISDGELRIEKTSSDNATSLHKNDGFGVVEFDDEGNVIRRKIVTDEENGSPRMITMQSFEVGTLGLNAVMRLLPTENLKEWLVQPVDEAGNVLELYGLYRLTKGLNSVPLFSPVDSNFHHRLMFRPGIPQQIFGFTTDGRLAHADAKTISKLLSRSGETQQLKMTVSAEAVKNIETLKQLLAF